MDAKKQSRILYLYQALMDGTGIQKKDAAAQFGINERSLQRDIDDLRSFFSDQIPAQEIFYDPKSKRYYLSSQETPHLTNSEILAVCKILLESRSMRKDEMLPILDKLISCCIPEKNKKAVNSLIANEKLHYIEPHHQQHILDGLWEIGQAIHNQNLIELEYKRTKEPSLVTRIVEPMGLMFSEYYFYLVAFIRDIDKKNAFDNPDDPFPTIYRIDRIQSFKTLDEHFKMPYRNRFQEGEFRKRIQFMYGGRLQTIKFQYTGSSIEAVLDRLPTAEIIDRNENGWIIKAEVFGNGIEMWLRSQGNNIMLI